MLAPFHPPLICALLLLSSQITNYYAESQAPHVSLLRTRYSCVHEGFDWPTACSPPRGLSLDSSFPRLPISLSLLPLYFFCQSLSLSLTPFGLTCCQLLVAMVMAVWLMSLQAIQGGWPGRRPLIHKSHRGCVWALEGNRVSKTSGWMCVFIPGNRLTPTGGRRQTAKRERQRGRDYGLGSIQV